MNENIKKAKDSNQINEFLSNFLSDSHKECFKLCFKDFSLNKVNEEKIFQKEDSCFESCISKYFLAYSNIGDKLI